MNEVFNHPKLDHTSNLPFNGWLYLAREKMACQNPPKAAKKRQNPPFGRLLTTTHHQLLPICPLYRSAANVAQKLPHEDAMELANRLAYLIKNSHAANCANPRSKAVLTVAW
ncbi:MAG: hypothetical protein WCS94_09670 [Verrucomicrobiota bacterium]